LIGEWEAEKKNGGKGKEENGPERDRQRKSKRAKEKAKWRVQFNKSDILQ